MREQEKTQVPHWRYLALGTVVVLAAMFTVVEASVAIAYGKEDMMLQYLGATAAIVIFAGIPTAYLITREIHD